MAKQVINVGTASNDGTGDTLKAGAQKINDNFTEVYNVLGGANGAPLSIVSGVLAGNGIVVSSKFGDVLVSANTASDIDAGVVKVGTGLSISETGVLSSEVYTLPTAAPNILGGVKVGFGLVINSQGVLSATVDQYTLPTASTSQLGGVKVDGSSITIANGVISSVTTESDRLVNGDYTLILDSDGDVTVSTGSVIASSFVTTAGSSIFQRSSDAGLNIRSDVSGRPIYMYNYGTDGDGTNGSEVDILNNTVNIYANWGTADESKWSFKNFDDGEGGKYGGFVTPTMVLGSVNSEDQLSSLLGTNSITLGNTGLKSYVRIGSADEGSFSNKISLIANTTGDFVDGLGYTSEGTVSIRAGGEQSPTVASLEMGKGETYTHGFPPPPTEPTYSATTNSSIVGGLASYGDIVITGGNRLYTRAGIVFQDGTLQNTAYQCRADVTVLRDIVVTVPVDVDTVIWTGFQEVGAVKLVVLAVMDTTRETQASEIMGVISPYLAAMPIVTHGTVYTGSDAIVTFDGAYDPQTTMYQVRARPVNHILGLTLTVQITELYTVSGN